MYVQLRSLTTNLANTNRKENPQGFFNVGMKSNCDRHRCNNLVRFFSIITGIGQGFLFYPLN